MNSIFSQKKGPLSIREFVKNNLPILTILFPLFCVEFLLNNSLFLKKLVLTKENIITNMGKLFFTNSLKCFLTSFYAIFPIISTEQSTAQIPVASVASDENDGS
jgi:hypothetical protein